MANIFKLPARLDTVNAPEIEKALQPLLCTEKHLIMDFSECSYVSSMGIRIVLMAKKKLMAKNGELFLTGICPAVLGVFEMSGMTAIFAIKKCVSEAEKAIEALSGKSSHSTDFSSWDNTFCYSETGGTVREILWKGNILAGYNELKMALGVGVPADDVKYDQNKFEPFVSFGCCAGFWETTQNGSFADFRVALHPEQAGIYLSTALSFGDKPTGSFKSTDKKELPLAQILQASVDLRRAQYPGSFGDSLSVVFCHEGENPSITIVLVPDDEPLCSKGAVFCLGQWRSADSFTDTLSRNLTFDNIIDVKLIDNEQTIFNPQCFVFYVSDAEEYSKERLVVEVEEEEEPLELYKEFLARRIYTDSARIVIKKLHGGFSAQTFQVNSFDSDGRRLRPTVMKVAAKDMIERESSRCQKCAQPYIMNNSAQVLGTEFFGEMGALRYNFVGIGGGDSELKWLTNYYLEDSFEKLEPLFDKIFLKILHPWYGQAVKKKIYPYVDHDPTLTFFPQIYDVAKDVLGVDASQKMIYVEELGREMVNPYGYLQNIFPERRDFHFEYWAGVCHGDLNMQNILIDENKNIYLIDFSETKLRAAISDFARLEAIMLVDNAPEEKDYLKMITALYSEFVSLDTPLPDVHSRDVLLTGKMRQYAINCAHGDTNPLPYYFALLEWILPIVCYTNKPLSTKRLSMIVSALLVEKVEYFYYLCASSI